MATQETRGKRSPASRHLERRAVFEAVLRLYREELDNNYGKSFVASDLERYTSGVKKNAIGNLLRTLANKGLLSSEGKVQKSSEYYDFRVNGYKLSAAARDVLRKSPDAGYNDFIGVRISDYKS